MSDRIRIELIIDTLIETNSVTPFVRIYISFPKSEYMRSQKAT
jgi:hypothetical protein